MVVVCNENIKKIIKKTFKIRVRKGLRYYLEENVGDASDVSSSLLFRDAYLYR